MGCFTLRELLAQPDWQMKLRSSSQARSFQKKGSALAMLPQWLELLLGAEFCAHLVNVTDSPDIQNHSLLIMYLLNRFTQI